MTDLKNSAQLSCISGYPEITPNCSMYSFSTFFINLDQCIILAAAKMHSSSFLFSVCTLTYRNLFGFWSCGSLWFLSILIYLLLLVPVFCFSLIALRFIPVFQYRIQYPRVHSLILCSPAIILIDFPWSISFVIISFNNVILWPAFLSLVLVTLIFFLPFYDYLYWFIAGL